MAVPKSIQIRDVPDDVHATLRVRAATAGMSLSDYLRTELTRLTERPTLAEVMARVASREGRVERSEIVRVIREMRDGPGAA